MNRPMKSATVAGLHVEARPVPFRLVRKLIEAEQRGDDASRILVMAETVSECVSLLGGQPVDIDELPIEDVAAIYAFAVGAKVTSADFTPPVSPDGTGADGNPQTPPT